MEKTTEITKAFKELRKEGYIALQRHLCCGSCAAYDIGERLKAKGIDPEQGKYVFYHKQSAADLDATGACYMGWSGDGEFIKSVFEKNGLKVDWDGKSETCIRVIESWSKEF